MEFAMGFVAAALLIVGVLGGKYGPENRPAFLSPNVKPRPTISTKDVGEWGPRT